MELFAKLFGSLLVLVYHLIHARLRLVA